RAPGWSEMGLGLADLPPEMLNHVIKRLLEWQPNAVGVLVHGSYAQGRAGRFSDLDVLVLTSSEPVEPHQIAWFEQLDGRPFHVSPGSTEVDGFFSRIAGPASWSLGFPTEEP